MDSADDRFIELDRYDKRSSLLLGASLHENLYAGPGSCCVPYTIRAPYEHYESVLASNINPVFSTLEIASGFGEFTHALLASKQVIATDISTGSLMVLKKRYGDFVNLNYQIADLISLPFPDDGFDLVACAGGLSYGDGEATMNEIYRVLKPGGKFICVDSLNENRLYRFNRWVHFLRGHRSRSTLLNMPNFSLIRRYEKRFHFVNCYFFGSIAWLMPLTSLLFGVYRARLFSDWFDVKFNIKKSAFKFVMIGEFNYEVQL
jgi:ubiquinone/menaquinone biosynthesis C-methylase UbiE